jgi:ribosomal protein S21
VDRGIQGDILNRSVANFDRDSQKQIESALGTLQRRENRAGIVADLREDQAFNKDILLRKQSLFNDQSALSNRQDQYQQADVLKNIDDLVQSRQALTAGFGDFSTRITNASDEFYTLSESVKEVNRQLELLSRNLR